MQLHAAIDLRSDNSVLAVIDKQDVLQLRRTLPIVAKEPRNSRRTGSVGCLAPNQPV